MPAPTAFGWMRVIQTMGQWRLEYYRGLLTWDHFGKGWTNRTHDVEKAALAMAGSSAPVAVA